MAITSKVVATSASKSMATPPKPAPRRPARATDALKPFQLEGVRDTGEKVGDGAYATVKKLYFRGLKCVGKKVHALLYEMANQHERREMLRRFVSECELLSRLHHPCIVQFLGVYFEEGSQLPVMVMEYLYTTLAECLKKYGILPEEITYGILEDVALGLRYLHEYSPSIIHRDLSANNVLLATDMSAKISDLGVAKILNLSPAQITQRISTQAPGTPCYMPPEALVSKPSYTSKIDSYSYGVLVIHVLCGEWPFPGDAFTEAPNSPGSFLPVSEFDRRKKHLLKIGLDHPLMGLIRRCLSNAPASRPEASEILGRIEDLKSSLPPSFENKLEMIQQIQSQSESTDGKELENKHLSKDDTEQSRLRQIVDTQMDEIETQKNLIETLRRENEAHRTTMRQLQTDLTRQYEECRNEIEVKTREVQYLRQLSESQSRKIEAKDGQIESKAREVASQNWEILSLREQLEKLSIPLPSPSTIEPSPCFPVNADAPVKWRRCADLPVAMNQLRSVLLKGMVYVGGGYTGPIGAYRPEEFLVFQYDPRKDRWDSLAPCPVRLFTLSQFQGHLIAVGGKTRQGVPSNKVYRYREESQEWEEYLKPMPTARASLSVIATPSAIITCAGGAGYQNNFATVEVYTVKTGHWCTGDSLPNPYGDMTSIVIDDSCYLLGGGDKSDAPTRIVLHAQVSSLIESALPPAGILNALAKAFRQPTWKTLPDTPLFYSTAASVGGKLLMVGGHGVDQQSASIHMFIPADNAWVKMPSADLPVAVCAAAAIELPGKKLLVCGGMTNRGLLNGTYMGSFAE